MGKILTVICLVCSACLAEATVIADWTYQTSQPSSSGAATYGPISPETGSGSATGVHAISTTTWSTPNGNGSSHSFNANDWSLGDYFQFKVSTVGFQNIMVSWDQASSSTGPTGFKLQYSSDGISFTDYANYAVNTDATSWSGTVIPGDQYSYDLSAVTTLNNDLTVYFRLTQTSATGNGSGTDRNDNFEIQSVPEPAGWGAISALGLIGICGLREWRQRRCGEKLKSCPVK